MAGSALPDGIEVEVLSLTSAPYVELTLQALETFGCASVAREHGVYRVLPTPQGVGRGRRRVVVESDFSAVAYPAAAACITGGEVCIQGVSADSRQGDRAFLDVLASLGGQVEWRDGEVVVGGRPRRALDIDLLTYGSFVGQQNGISIPRPHMLDYAFVLKPLADLLPDDKHPGLERNYAELWREFPQKEEQPLWVSTVDWDADWWGLGTAKRAL